MATPGAGAGLARRGPSGLLTIMKRGPENMGKAMAKSFVYNVIVSAVAAYVATIGLTTATSGTDVFRLVATVAFAGYAGALGWNLIWFNQAASSVFKAVLDGLVYGVATGALFMVLWPSP